MPMKRDGLTFRERGGWVIVGKDEWVGTSKNLEGYTKIWILEEWMALVEPGLIFSLHMTAKTRSPGIA